VASGRQLHGLLLAHHAGEELVRDRAEDASAVTCAEGRDACVKMPIARRGGPWRPGRPVGLSRKLAVAWARAARALTASPAAAAVSQDSKNHLHVAPQAQLRDPARGTVCGMARAAAAAAVLTGVGLAAAGAPAARSGA
jgi:hypothetical protein